MKEGERLDYFNKLKIEDLDENNKAIAELIGFENFKKLVKNYGGGSLYICKKETLTRKLRDEEIMHCFENGDSYITLSQKFNLSQTVIKEIISKSVHHRNYVIKKQIRLDDLNGE